MPYTRCTADRYTQRVTYLLALTVHNSYSGDMKQGAHLTKRQILCRIKKNSIFALFRNKAAKYYCLIACCVSNVKKCKDTVGIYGRTTVENPVNDALEATELGEVYAGGSGERGTDIAIDIFDGRKLEQALTLICKVLREVGAPATTQIIRTRPTRNVYPLDEP